jgi:predicted MFS family arabinose efflux permease
MAEREVSPDESPSSSSSYRAILGVPGFGRIVSSALLTRAANQMYALVLVLFVLARFHSPQLAGLAVLFSIAPGLILSPIAGAVLDRGARVPLIVLDYAVGAAAMTLLSVLAITHHLPSPALLLIVAVASLTQPLSAAGLRSLLPLIVPRALWDRVNAVDSAAYLVATVMGPGLGGAVVAIVGSTHALLVPAAILFAGAVLLTGIPVPPIERATTPMLRDAWQGLVYVLRNPALRMLAVMVSVFNVGSGAMTVAIPVLVVERLHGGSSETGVMFAVMGGAGIVSGVAVGRFDSEGKERRLLTVGALISAAALGLLVLAPSVTLAIVAMALSGAGNGPLDLGLFSLRQRATDAAWFGRAFAVSMSLNYLGIPVGAALAGPVVARSVTATLALAAAVMGASAAAPALVGRRRSSAS